MPKGLQSSAGHAGYGRSLIGGRTVTRQAFHVLQLPDSWRQPHATAPQLLRIDFVEPSELTGRRAL